MKLDVLLTVVTFLYELSSTQYCMFVLISQMHAEICQKQNLEEA